MEMDGRSQSVLSVFLRGNRGQRWNAVYATMRKRWCSYMDLQHAAELWVKWGRITPKLFVSHGMQKRSGFQGSVGSCCWKMVNRVVIGNNLVYKKRHVEGGGSETDTFGLYWIVPPCSCSPISSCNSVCTAWHEAFSRVAKMSRWGWKSLSSCVCVFSCGSCVLVKRWSDVPAALRRGVRAQAVIVQTLCSCPSVCVSVNVSVWQVAYFLSSVATKPHFAGCTSRSLLPRSGLIPLWATAHHLVSLTHTGLRHRCLGPFLHVCECLCE